MHGYSSDAVEVPGRSSHEERGLKFDSVDTILDIGHVAPRMRSVD